MKLKIYTDGGARGNPGPAAFGVVIYDEEDQLVFEYSDGIGRATNNVAEYCGLIAGLELAKRFQASEVECYTDSTLLMNQMSGNFKIKADHIQILHSRAKKMESYFDQVHYRHLPRENPMIQQADKLLNETLDTVR